MKIIPALLTDSVAELRRMLLQAADFADYIQIDFMDGRFVSSSSITPREFVNEELSVAAEAHLMVLEPAEHFPTLKEANISKVVFHFEAVDDVLGTLTAAERLGLKSGLAINPETDAAAFLPWIESFDSILLLGVHPGFYGRGFIPEILKKIPEIRRVFPRLPVGVDGGVKLDNIRIVKQAGPDFVCVGSAIFKDNNPKARYEEFVKAVQ